MPPKDLAPVNFSQHSTQKPSWGFTRALRKGKQRMTRHQPKPWGIAKQEDETQEQRESYLKAGFKAKDRKVGL